MSVSWQRILLVGVGGQGVLSAGRWLGDAAAAAGLPVTVQQAHGLSQRGGSVQTAVALGGARSPEIAAGMADVLVALEPMEGARALPKVSGRTVALVNTRALLPVSLQAAGRPYPPLGSLLGPLEEAARTVVAVDATALAEKAGSPRSANVVMLGLLAGAGLLPFAALLLLEVILDAGVLGLREINQRAFQLGEAATSKPTA
jgi:indolepyruvate ferredoxin oxidoreductase beta subunit